MYRTNEEEIIKEMLPSVKRIAMDLLHTLPKNVEVDDLIQEGVLALLSAIRRYDPKKGVSMYSFVVKRIKGAMYDYLRKIDWMPRNLRKNVKEVEKAIHELENHLNKHPSIEEIALHTGLSTNEVKRALDETVRKQLLRLDEFIYEGLDSFSDIIKADDEPSENAFREIILEKVAEAIRTLSKREQLVLSLRFEQDLSLKEIGTVIGVSESRVSQILSSSLIKIKRYILGDNNDNTS
ncbi:MULTISPECIES: FliA/WhiG family RNA polymerase sigma factor [Pseudothermotoga]|jgi:RNA polymerase, sigma 28 subunit, SigD/FliA/WhiG|uniref:RNA polymerase, sigma 28 subunit, FliA/WhiG n=1 Tax=Pseudothermotoga lettingae (strain ATCC BAA-301 / DSM 14385 / NBRC 107922 / TMO) TaxID=416591 RepID=A8F4U9_PSELT|nr:MULTISPECIES: FliA/WhiG family RNA polymerase sigma factor [Pseudothermotoga]ABV33183.1 RNA polymerase, sigma 28 subunit, FliA/WhiG [Pseudothermotoga lettingae TMO]GLI49900.1 DNA-directed RNA polymerase sigma-70 factor [Pseudothermotoga lettingae TMO]HBJ81713.1 FliA/WhiG family RNA polymerase sigma factor [Pseudothermotoga sp.]